MDNFPKFYKCGCSIIDEEKYSSSIINIVFRRCKKHQKSLQQCSWETWAKTFAPAQYKKYKKG